MSQSEKIIYAITSGILGFFASIWVFVLWMFIFVMFDLISGCMAAKKRGEKLESRKLRQTVNKLVWYFTAILLAQALDVKILHFVEIYLANMTAAIICGVELYSVLENAYTITGNRVFWMLTQFTCKKIKDVTDCDITDK